MGQHAGWPCVVDRRDSAGMRGDLVRLCNAAPSESEMTRYRVLAAGTLLAFLGACGEHPEPLQYGPNPELAQPHRGLLPKMTIAEPARWGDQRPRVPQAYVITAIATDLAIP